MRELMVDRRTVDRRLQLVDYRPRILEHRPLTTARET